MTASRRDRRDPLGMMDMVDAAVGAELHVKQIESLGGIAAAAVHAGKLGVQVIGRAMACSNGLLAKYAIKQVDRMLSNDGIDPWALFAHWVPFVVGARPEIIVAMDWTDFDADGHSTISISMVTRHGRATPLLWKTVLKDGLKDHRNDYEDQILGRLREVLPQGVRVTVLADRGFGDQKLYQHLKRLGFDFVIRFRGVILVEDAMGVKKTATEWVPTNGRALKISPARITQDAVEIPAVVCVKKRGMKEPWLLATSLSDASAADIIKLYGKRFTIEETFRDTKNPRLGMGLSDCSIKRVDRRDRLLLLGALATAMLTILGAAGEANGIDRWFKANTVKTRTHSLFRQGCMYYDAMPTMRHEMLGPLITKFHELLLEHHVFVNTLGIV